jgi:SAM-dependent methyltransferase
MHEPAYNFVRMVACMLGRRRAVCEFGSRNVNGSVRPLFADAPVYVGVDAREGPGVDVVCDAADYRPDRLFDTVVCTETLEHTPRVRDICANAARILSPGGVFLVTAAAPPRTPHSAEDGGPLRPGEYYGNVSEAQLRPLLEEFFGCVLIDTWTSPGDIYALAVKTGGPATAD